MQTFQQKENTQLNNELSKQSNYNPLEDLYSYFQNKDSKDVKKTKQSDNAKDHKLQIHQTTTQSNHRDQQSIKQKTQQVKFSPQRNQNDQDLNEFNMYEGCQYNAPYYQSNNNQIFNDEQNYQYSQNDNNERQISYQSYSYYSNSQSENDKTVYQNWNSQPTSYFQTENSYFLDKLKRKKQQEQPHYNSHNVSRSVNIKKDRSVNALVSPKKIKTKKSQSQCLQSSVSNSQMNNLKLIKQKMKKQNKQNQAKPIFFNPFNNQATQSIDFQIFKKHYRINYQDLFKKISQCHEKLSTLGEKLYFKDKQNQASIDQLFKIIGLKSSSKLGKSKSFRELKAIFKYLNFDNPESHVQKDILEKQAQGKIQDKKRKNVSKLQKIYIDQFKLLLGYQTQQQIDNSPSKNNLFGYGFKNTSDKK